MPFNQPFQVLDSTNYWGSDIDCKKRKNVIFEPNSVLDHKRSRISTSPSASSSTLSTSLGSTDPATASPEVGGTNLDEKCTIGGPRLDDLEAMLSDSSGHDQSFLHWISGGVGTGTNVQDHDGDGSTFGLMDNPYSTEPIGAPLHLPNPLFSQEAMEEKSLDFNQNIMFPNQNPSFLLPVPQFTNQLQTHFVDSANYAPTANTSSLFLRRNQLQNPSFMNHNAVSLNTSDDLAGQLFKAAEFIESRNIIGAREILARLNQCFPSQPIIGKPLFRSSFYFMEALRLIINNSLPNMTLSTPFDVLLKLGTYKSFTDISPIVQFTSFTSIQAILEETNGHSNIHIIDFDVGFGGHWSSFMQELAHSRGGGNCSLKITVFASNSSHHPLELHLTKENLSHFAAELNISFEFNVLGLDSFDASTLLSLTSPTEAIAVNLPIGSGINYQSIPIILRVIKQMNPKIVVSIEHGNDRSDFTFSSHFLHALQSCTVLLESIDASGASQDVASKIERYIVQPRIENVMLSRHRAMEKMVPWRSLFSSIGFAPLQFSNFNETQAECLLKRVQVRGFQVEKRQATLFLCWQRGELVSVSAWK